MPLVMPICDFIRGCKNSLLVSPSLPQSAANCDDAYSSMPRPLRKCFCHPINRDKSGCFPESSIVCLFFVRCPSTVLGRIISVIIYTLYGMRVAWTPSHISDKLTKVKPFRGNGNSSAAIVFVFSVVGVVASCLHCLPNSVFWHLTTVYNRVSHIALLIGRMVSGLRFQPQFTQYNTMLGVA